MQATEKLKKLLKARSTKYIKRTPKPGGGYKYIYAQKKEFPKPEKEPSKVTEKAQKYFKSPAQMRSELITDGYHEQAINKLPDDRLELAYLKFKHEDLIVHQDYKNLDPKDYTKKEWAQLEKYKTRMLQLENSKPSHYLDAAQTTELTDYELFSILNDDVESIKKNLERRQQNRKAIGEHQGRKIEKRSTGAEGRLEQALQVLTSKSNIQKAYFNWQYNLLKVDIR